MTRPYLLTPYTLGGVSIFGLPCTELPRPSSMSLPDDNMHPPSDGLETVAGDVSGPDGSTNDNASIGSAHSTSSLKEKSEALCSTIEYRMPFVHGTLSIESDEEIKVFYGKPGDAHCIDLAHPTEEQLCHLEEACDPATFGRNQQDVLDETYRTAGKMDIRNFSTNLLPRTTYWALSATSCWRRTTSGWYTTCTN